MSIHGRHGAIAIILFLLAAWIPGDPSSVRAQDNWGDGGFGSSMSWGSGWGSGNNWLGSSNSNTRWRLGVDGTNSEVGLAVSRVEPNSPAAQMGIIPRDIIVCVGGARVGRVGGRIFDLGDLLNQQADARGRVELVVQSSRTGRLTPVSVSLDSGSQSALTGELLLPGNTGLPLDAVITLQLENASRPHYAVRNGEYSFRVPTFTRGAIPFKLDYDRNYIFPNDTYRLSAYITSRGRTIYVTPRPEFVLTRGNPTTVRMQLVPPSGVGITSATDFNSAGGVYTAGYTNYDLITQRVSDAYQRYLNRQPSALELAAWHQLPDADFRLTRLPMELMASQEYFDRVGDNNTVWIRNVFGEVIGRTPSTLEFDQWMRRFADVRYSRTEVLNQMQSVAGQ